LLSFFGFLRRSEALALKLKDLFVRRTAQGKLYLHMLIRKSKTDVFSKGVELCITYASNSGIHIVVLVQLYMDFLITSGVSPEAALFQSFVGRSSVPVVGSVLGKNAMAIRLKYYIGRVAGVYPGLDLKVETNASHSRRRGGVSAAWQCEVGRELLKGHGRWSSDAIDLYLQASVETKLTVTASI
jgi:hypothetical protein